MKVKKLSQKQIAFCILYQSFKEDKEKYIPAWKFVGEVFIEPLNRHEFMSYKCPTRLTDLFTENPDLLERIEVKGLSGSKYFAYRIRDGATSADIKDHKIEELRKNLAINYKYKNAVPALP